jgi:chemotaxis protein histidine kinase CheA
MAERVAELEVYTYLDDSELERGFDRVDRALERERAKIERQHAEWKVDVDLDELKRDLKEAEARVKAADKEIEQVEKGRERRNAQARARYAKARRDELAQQVKDAEQGARAQKIENREHEKTIKLLEAEEKAEAAKAKVREREERKALARMKQEQRERDAITRQREKDDRVRERIATKAAREAEKAERARQRELASIPKMRREYAELVTKIERLNDLSRRTHDQQAKMVVDLKIAEAIAKMQALHETLERVGSPVDLEVDLHPGRDLGTRLRSHFMRNTSLTGVMATVGADLGQTMGRGMVTRFRRVSDKGLSGIGRDIGVKAGNAALGGLSRIGKALSNLSDATIRLGPFTTTIRQAVVGMSLFAPIILDVVGALGSLVSVLGSASVGAIGAATAGMGAFGIVLGSAGALMLPLMRDFKNLNSLQDAYHKQVLKTGAGSDKAKTKLKEFNHALGEVTPTTRKAFLGIDKLQSDFRGLAKDVRPDFFNALGSGLATLRHGLDRFGPEMQQSFRLVAHGADEMFKALRSSEADRLFQTLFDQGQAALPAFGRALGNLAHSVGNIAAAFSMVLPSLGGGFETWTRGIERATEDTDRMNHIVTESTESMRKFGHFAQAATRFLTAFFGAGVGSGQSFLDTMTNALNRWTEFLSTTKGKNDLSEFFSEAVRGTQAFYGTLAPVVTSFVRWAANIAPFARAFFQGASAVSQLVNEFLRLTGLRGPLTALVTTLGVLWGIGKIRAATAAVSGFTRALLGLSTAQEAVAASQAASGAAGAVGRAGTAAGFIPPGMRGTIATTLEKDAAAAAKAGGRFALLRGGVAAATTTLGTFATMATGPVGIGLAAATYGAYKLYEAHNKLSESTQHLLNNDDQLNQGIELQAIRTKDLAGVATQLQQAHLTEAQAQRTVNTLRKHGKTGTEQYKQALINLRYAQQQSTAAQEAWTQAANEQKGAADQQIKAAKANVSERQKNVDKLREEIQRYRDMGVPVDQLKDKYEKLAQAQSMLRGEQGVLQQAMDRATLGALNQQRALKMLPPIAADAAKVVGDLTRSLGKDKVAKIALKFPDARQAQKVMGSLNKAIQSGTPKSRAFSVVANSKDAEQALRRLNRIRLTPKRLAIIESGGTKAVRMIEQITGKKIPKKLVPIVEQGGPRALAVLRDIFGYKLPKKTQHIEQKGAPAVLTMLGAIAKKVLPNKTFKVAAKDGASSILRNVLGYLASLHDKTVNVTTVHRDRGGGSFKIAQGGYSGAVMDREAKQANNIPADMSERTRGGRYQRPTFLVGEENRPEFVIATNPAYREKNVAHWMQAAKALGIPGFATGGVTTDDTIDDVEFVQARANAPKHDVSMNDPGEPPKLIKPQGKGRSGKKKSANLMANVLDTFEAGRDTLGRMLRVAEGNVEDPGSYVDEVKDADGNVTGYTVNESKVTGYKTQIKTVIDMRDKLLRWIAGELDQIKVAVPTFKNAREAYQADQRDHTAQLKKAEKELHKLQDKKRPSHKDKARIKHLQRTTIPHLKKLLGVDKKGAAVNERRRSKWADEKGPIDDELVAQADERNDWAKTYNAVWTEAQDALKESQAGLSDNKGGGGGGASATLTYGEQAALTDAANAQTLRDYGSNFQTGSSGYGMNIDPGTAAFGGGQGVQGNASVLSGVNATNAVASTLSGGSSGGAGSSYASSGLAARAVAGGTSGGSVVSSGGAATPTGGGDTNVSIVNNYATAPEDPHTYSQAMAFEIGATL